MGESMSGHCVHARWRAAALSLVLACCTPAADKGPAADSGLELPKPLPHQFESLPPRPKLDGRKLALGRRLFDDVRLSGDETVACSSCHLRELAFTDGNPRALVPSRPVGKVNVPTLLNVRYNYRYNWDGEFLSLEAQLDALIERQGAMRSSWEVIAPRVAADAGYARAFAELYPDGVTRKNLTDALLSYLMALTTPGSKFDSFLDGKGALSEEEREGYLLFREYGCSSCHQGRNVGGNLLQRFGVMEDYFQQRPGLEPGDYGYYNVTHDEADRHKFRVPSLRNVALTAPYFHDGSAATLDEAVGKMAFFQLGRTLSPVERRRIVAFLQTLTGDLGGLP